MIMFLRRHRQEKIRRAKKKMNVSDVVTTQIGSFVVKEEGVVARLRPPISHFSAVIPWRMVPTSLAALRIIIDGEPEEAFDGLIGRLREFGLSEDHIGNLLGTDSGNVKGLVDSSITLSRLCPIEDVSREIDMVRRMSPRSLTGYVAPFLEYFDRVDKQIAGQRARLIDRRLNCGG